MSSSQTKLYNERTEKRITIDNIEIGTVLRIPWVFHLDTPKLEKGYKNCTVVGWDGKGLKRMPVVETEGGGRMVLKSLRDIRIA